MPITELSISPLLDYSTLSAAAIDIEKTPEFKKCFYEEIKKWLKESALDSWQNIPDTELVHDENGHVEIMLTKSQFVKDLLREI